MSEILDQNNPTPISSHDQDNKIPVVEQEIQVPNHELDGVLEILKNDDKLSQLMMSQSTNKKNAFISQIANTAMEELMKLLKTNEPLWLKSLHDGKFILQRDSYQRMFLRINCLKGPHARIESSKDSRVVNMSLTQLVEMFINSDKWIDLFPTIVKKAQTVKVFESGSLENRNGALQLMNAKMHVLSHLVPTRTFHFLRYCKQIEVGTWVIVDVSVDSSEDKTTVSCAWRLPSGCLIQEITQGLCRVSWMEHVEVNDNIQTHQLFRDIIINTYGARRWILTLKRMCERFECASTETIPSYEARGVVKSLEGRKSIMQLAHRMVKIFCRTLDMEDNTNFPHLTRINNGEVTISVRMNKTVSDVPKGMILSAATSFWLPLSPQSVFDYMIDNKERAKWEPLWYGNPGHELQRISTGSNPRNFISITRPVSCSENNNTVTLRESYADALGSMMVYSAFDMEIMNFAMRGEDTSQLLVLPSGFTISWDGQPNALEGSSGQVGRSRGSVVTLMLQLLASSSSEMDKVDMEFVGYVTTLLSSTVEKIKSALNRTN
uniref:Homeobox-leucine zipper protein HDG11 n=1 Tax=Cajanus cajan TaxID=3821 RepID=A0A151S680_CAJCA|nr:Homeobox-leucine zipper protein HDG11 [Cajanus cajan]